MSDGPQARPVIVTAADERYARTLWQALRSAERVDLHKSARWIAYDLGITGKWRRRLSTRFPWCEFRTFDFSKRPSHVKADLKCYAWKACVVAEVARDQHGALFWFDSATIFRRDLTEPLATLLTEGIWYLRGQSALGAQTDARTTTLLATPPHNLVKAEIVSGCVGFNLADDSVSKLVANWEAASLRQDIIAPNPPRHQHHKYDQSILGSLIFAWSEARGASIQTAEVDISSHRPVTFITTRNKVRNGVPIWCDPFVRGYYWSYKTLDQTWLRWQSFRRS